MERKDTVMNEMETLKQWIEDSKRIVFFGGAGVSTESGIPDFRSVDGLYNQKYAYPPETIISHSFYKFIRMQSLMRLIRLWQSLRRKGSSAQ